MPKNIKKNLVAMKGPKIEDYFGPKIKIEPTEPEIIWLPTPAKEKERAPTSLMANSPSRHRLPLATIQDWFGTPIRPETPNKFVNGPQKSFLDAAAELNDQTTEVASPPRPPLGPHKHWVETPTCPGTEYKFTNVPRKLFADGELYGKTTQVGPTSPSKEAECAWSWNDMEGEDKENGMCRQHIPASPSCEPEASWDLPDAAALLGENVGNGRAHTTEQTAQELNTECNDIMQELYILV